MTLRELELKIAAGTATEQDFAAFGREDVVRIKSTLPVLYRAAATPSVNDLVDVGSIVVPPDPAQRVIELIANVQLGDRMGDLIVSNPPDCEKFGGKGWETVNFLGAGGPYLWSHSPWTPAVGKVLECVVKRVPVQVEGEGDARAWALVCPVQFFADARFGELAIPAYMLTRAGITASSVGFLPKIFHIVEDEKERAKLGLGRWGVVLPQNELLELSKAQVPANPWSVGTGKAAGEAEKRIVDTLKRWVGEGKLAESLAGDFVKAFPLGERDAAERLAAKVRGFVPQAVAARGKQCTGLECLAFDELQAAAERRAAAGDVSAAAALELDYAIVGRADGVPIQPADEDAKRRHKAAAAAAARGEAHDCGCGAKTLEEKLAAAEAELATLRAARAADATEDVPARSMKRIRRALDRASEAVEELAIVVDDEAGDDDAEQKTPDLPPQLSHLPPTLAADLNAVRADPKLLELVTLLLRQMVGKPLGGASRAPSAAVAHGAAGSDAGPAVAALKDFQREVAGAAS